MPVRFALDLSSVPGNTLTMNIALTHSSVDREAKMGISIARSFLRSILSFFQSPCVLKLTLPQRPEPNVHRRKTSKPRKICRVAKSVQTDTNDRSLSPLSPSADGHEFSPIGLASPAFDVSEKNSALPKGSPLSSPVRPPCTPALSKELRQASRDDESSQPVRIKYEESSPPSATQNSCQCKPHKLSPASTSPTCDTYRKSPSSSVSPSGDRSRDPKDSELLEGCDTSAKDDSVTHSSGSSSCTTIVNNVTSVPTKELSLQSAEDSGTAKIVKRIENSETIACSISQSPKSDVPRPLDTLSRKSVTPVTDSLQNIDSKETNSAIPLCDSAKSQEVNETSENVCVKEVDRTIGDIEVTDRVAASCDTPKVDLQISDQSESTVNGANGKTKSVARCISLKSTLKCGSNADSSADVQENSSNKDSVAEGSTCEKNATARTVLRHEFQAAEETKLNSDDKLKVTSSDSPFQAQRVDSRESPRDKNSARTPNSSRRKKSNKFNWQEKVSFGDAFFSGL